MFGSIFEKKFGINPIGLTIEDIDKIAFKKKKVLFLNYGGNLMKLHWSSKKKKSN